MKNILILAGVLCALFVAMPNQAAAQKKKPVTRTITGTISEFECGDNCYLTIRDSKGRKHDGLCNAKICDKWNDGEGAMPDSYKGKQVTVTVGRGKQYNAEHQVMGSMNAFTRITFVEKYSTYGNARFGYQIDYPKDKLTARPESENGDGRVFTSADGKVELRVWGEYNAPGGSLRERYAAEQKQHEWCCVEYKTLLSNGYVISGGDNKTIHYQKTIYRNGKGDTARYANFTISYPKARKAEFDPIIRHMAASVRIN